MSLPDYADYDGLGLADLVRRREVTPVELVQAAIDQIERLNPTLNAVVYTAYDEAQKRAGETLTGPFAGVPFLLKDILGTKKGWPTRQGARYLDDVGAPQDCTLVTRFQSAGVIPMGKTNVPEFGLLPITESSLYGPAHNPWNADHSPGFQAARRRLSPPAWFPWPMAMTAAARFGFPRPAAGWSVSSPPAPAPRSDRTTAMSWEGL
jgi:amidase